MKRILVFLSMFLIVVVCSSQTTDNSAVTRLLEDISTRVVKADTRGRYKLYPTQNIYTFLCLETTSGRIAQIQWSLKAKQEGGVYVNRNYLSFGSTIGEFELYPTDNMYQFILLNTIDGRCWHVQWGGDDDKRWIRQIYY